jgi:hypothetical protein
LTWDVNNSNSGSSGTGESWMVDYFYYFSQSKQWNALKLLNEKANFLSGANGEKILEI